MRYQNYVEKQKEKIYRPLLGSLSRLVKSAENMRIDEVDLTSLTFDVYKGHIQPILFRRLKRLSSEIIEFTNIAKACKSSFDLIIYQELLRLSMEHRILTSIDWIGIAEQLSNALSLQMMKGTKMTPSWVKDNASFFYDRIMKISDKEIVFINLINSIRSKADERESLLERLKIRQANVIEQATKAKLEVEKRARPPYYLSRILKDRLIDRHAFQLRFGKDIIED